MARIICTCGTTYHRPRATEEKKNNFPNCPNCGIVGGVINYFNGPPEKHHHTEKLLEKSAEKLMERLNGK